MRRLSTTCLVLCACGGGAPEVRPPIDPAATQPAAESQPASQPVAVTPPDAGSPPPPPPPQPQRVRITVLSASIDGKKPDGSAWDDGPAPPPELSGPLPAFLAAHPELDGADSVLGEPPQAAGTIVAARMGRAPDPVVYVELAGRTFRTPMVPNQFEPVWRFPLVVELVPAGDEIARITVVDWDGPGQADIIGDTIVPVRELWDRRVVELPRFGAVGRLLLSIEAAPELSQSRRVGVPGRATWLNTGIPITAGQDVTIRATGEVCSKPNDRSRCAGPEGQPRTSEANVPGFEARGHAGLTGALGDVRFWVGRDLRFVAPSSGMLLLGVNDRDSDNNSGEFEVSVEAR